MMTLCMLYNHYSWSSIIIYHNTNTAKPVMEEGREKGKLVLKSTILVITSSKQHGMDRNNNVKLTVESA